MGRQVTVELKVKLKMTVEEGVEVSEVVQEMEYEFTPATEGVEFTDSEILDYEAVDSK